MRLKKKRQLGKIVAKAEESGEEMEVRLATPQDSDDGYVSEEKPKKKQKKDKKDKKDKSDGPAKTAEERALELLDMDFWLNLQIWSEIIEAHNLINSYNKF